MTFVDRVVDNDICRLTLETKESGDVYAHLEVFQWSKSVYEAMLLTWVDVMNALRKKGISKVYAHSPKDEGYSKTLRFQMMFGFTPVSIELTPSGDEYYKSEVVL